INLSLVEVPAMARSSTRAVPLWQWLAAAVGSGAFLAFSLGCMSLSYSTGPGECYKVEDGICQQSGKVVLTSNNEIAIYYPSPYPSPPNLVVESPWDDYIITDQKPDHFRIKNASNFSRHITWTARGVRVPATIGTPVQS